MKRKYGIIAIALLCCALLGYVAQASSFYSSHAYLANVNIGPRDGVRELAYLGAYTTTAGAYVSLQAGGSTVYKVATAQSSAVTNVTLDSVTGLAAADTVLIVHANGTVDYRVIAGVGASGLCTFTAAPSAALTTGARLWELAAAARYDLPFVYYDTNTTSKTTLPLNVSGRLFQAAGVPFRITLTGTNCVLTATVID